MIDPANPALVYRTRRPRKQREEPWRSPLIGARVAVRFDGGKIYHGTINEFDFKHTERAYDVERARQYDAFKAYRVVYDDGDVEWVDTSDPDVKVRACVHACVSLCQRLVCVVCHAGVRSHQLTLLVCYCAFFFLAPLLARSDPHSITNADRFFSVCSPISKTCM
jgi:hypothetical protein